jgi:dTMP kinase
MFVLDRIAHNKSEGGIEELLADGFDVISDRYYYSTLAYQGQTTDYAWVKSMNVDCPEIRRPDVCIYLDLLPEDSLARISARGEAREIYENLDRLTGVRKAFLSTIEDLKRDRENIFVIDASRSPEEIAADVFRVINDSILKD